MRRRLLIASLVLIASVAALVISTYKQREQREQAVAWSRGMILARLDGGSASELSTGTIDRRPGRASWTISGTVMLPGDAGEVAERYTAVVEQVCRESTERRCWRLQALTLGTTEVPLLEAKAALPVEAEAVASRGPAASAAVQSASVMPDPASSAVSAAIEAAPPIGSPMAAAPFHSANMAATALAADAPASSAEVKAAARSAADLGPVPSDGPPIPARKPAPPTQVAAVDRAEPAASTRGDEPPPPLATAAGPDPRAESLVFLIQTRLEALGYRADRADGVMDEPTAAAITNYQRAAGLPADGKPSDALLQHLERRLLGRNASAEPTHAAAATPSSSNGDAAFREAFAAAEGGDIDRAIEAYSRAIEAGDLTPDNLVRAYNNRGNAYSAKGLFDRAIADYNQALQLDPGYAAAYNNRCSALHGKGSYDLAVADCNKAIRLKPDYAAAYNNRGSAFQDRGLYDRAIADYATAIRLAPQQHHAYFNRGAIYQAQGKIERAIADFRKAYALAPNNPRYGAKLRELGFAN